MDLYLIYKKADDKRHKNFKFKAKEHAENYLEGQEDNGFLTASDFYIVKFAEGFADYEKVDHPGVINTLTTSQSKAGIVDDFTLSYDATKQHEEIDLQTDNLIVAWCRGQGKNEAYYQRMGIKNGKTHVDFIAYENEVESIIASQAAKKF